MPFSFSPCLFWFRFQTPSLFIYLQIKLCDALKDPNNCTWVYLSNNVEHGHSRRIQRHMGSRLSRPVCVCVFLIPPLLGILFSFSFLSSFSPCFFSFLCFFHAFPFSLLRSFYLLISSFLFTDDFRSSHGLSYQQATTTSSLTVSMSYIIVSPIQAPDNFFSWYSIT